jgi:hypothetical protein
MSAGTTKTATRRTTPATAPRRSGPVMRSATMAATSRALAQASIDGTGISEQDAAYAARLLRGQVASQGEALRDWLDLSTRHCS